MKKSNASKSLITSVMAFLICIAMLVGTTYAWFTDNATTGVNEIQAGILDVGLVDASGNDLVGETLSFVKSQSNSGDTLRWEPGCVYELTPVYIKNNGDLALKFKIEVNGIDGDAKLLEVIDWSVLVGNTEIKLDEFEGTLAAASTSTDAIKLVGKMSTDADNNYQGLKASGISITVYAAQAPTEYDSYGNTYDADAQYSVSSSK